MSTAIQHVKALRNDELSSYRIQSPKITDFGEEGFTHSAVYGQGEGIAITYNVIVWGIVNNNIINV